MLKLNLHVWDVDDMYISSNPESKTGKQLRRKVYVERMDKNFNLTGDKFLCTLTDHSALAEINIGDIIEASLSFDVDEKYNQLVYAKIDNVNGKSNQY